MRREHPPPEVLTRFAAGSAVTPAESRWIVGHLLHGCPSCQRLLCQSFRPKVDPSAYDRILDGCLMALRRSKGRP